MPSRSTSRSFSALEPRLHYVSGAAVKKKWKKLPPSSQDSIREVLSSTQARSKNGKRKNGVDVSVEACVQEVTERLIDRLPRMPFPPSCDEQQFDFEATLHRVNSVEEQLTYNLHSTNLLRAQIAKEEQMLEEDQDEIERLKRSLKSSQALRRQQEKTLHPTARKLMDSLLDHELRMQQRRPCEIGSKNEKTVDFEDEDDLQPLLKQLRSHLESMGHNVQTLKPILGAIDRTRQHISIISSEALAAK